jgi:hypothetical protein
LSGWYVQLKYIPSKSSSTNPIWKLVFPILFKIASGASNASKTQYISLAVTTGLLPLNSSCPSPSRYNVWLSDERSTPFWLVKVNLQISRALESLKSSEGRVVVVLVARKTASSTAWSILFWISSSLGPQASKKITNRKIF